jgi:hypothetical protein
MVAFAFIVKRGCVARSAKGLTGDAISVNMAVVFSMAMVFNMGVVNNMAVVIPCRR